MGASEALAAPELVRESVVLSKIVDDLVRDVQQLLQSRRRPRATYRVQFNREFTFRLAAELVPYWNSLGISDVYASPYLKAMAGSTHGYDIVDHSTLNPDLGSMEDFHALTSALETHAMGHILDCVPNHMGVASDENLWWQDVLENGPGSRYSSFFDIDWNPPKLDLQSKVLLPVLGEQFGQVLESGQLKLTFQNGTFFIQYFNRRFPIAPKSFALILQHRLDQLSANTPADDPHFTEYQSILTALTHLPSRTETDPAKLEEREREKEVIKRRLQRLCDESPAIFDWICENVAIFNGQAGDPHSFDLLDELLDQQPYRLAFWRVASDEINYRRFFDVNELAAICMERPEVFERAHAFIFRLLEQGQLSGLRIDHADGLYDPTNYLWQLQERRFLQLCKARFENQTEYRGSDHANGQAENGQGRSESIAWGDVEAALRERFTARRDAGDHSSTVCPLYLVVEKILERNERLPATWPVHGSTGYDFMNDVNGLYVQSESAKAFDMIYSKFIGNKTPFAELVYEAKRLILRASMSSELHVLGHSLDRISERSRWTRDFTLHGQIQVLREVIACFPVYRTYTVGTGVLDRDRRYVEQAVARAKRRNPEISPALFDFVRDVLLLQGAEDLSGDDRTRRQSFVGRFQQLTGPMMAKAVEDTAYYRFNRLVSLNEVGGDPERFGISVEEFHQHNLERQLQRPYAMLATSTHDSKRSEDVRARINVLSEIPDDWKHRVARWARWNKRKKTKVDGDLAPSRNDEYLLYQTLAGTWPFDPPHGDDLAAYIARIQQYMTKAVREAKMYSSWIAPHEPYERAVHAFVESILRDDPISAFRTDFEPFARELSDCGLWNSLSQTLLKLTSPGIPDIYQGMELWNFSLVDPDNRRPVDYESRQRMLDELQNRLKRDDRQSIANELLASAQDGRIKLFVIAEALELRRRHPDLFTVGEYRPLNVIGSRANHVCAFFRQNGTETAMVVVPRLVARLTRTPGEVPAGPDVWGDTAIVLPSGEAKAFWRDIYTHAELDWSNNSSLPVSEILSVLPVGLLEAVRL